MKVKRWLIGITVAIVATIAVLGIAFFTLTNPAVKIFGWQELDVAKLERIHQTATIQDENGKILAENIYSKNRLYTPLTQVPQQTKDAFISIEDKRFYRHNGIDYLRMLGAAKNNLLSFSLKEGASTITQQLIKNTHLTNKKTFSRKLQEIRLAKELEKKYDKDAILEAYLNILYFGNNVYGIGQAAHTYFQKGVAELSLEESALLAGMINNPAAFNPLINPQNALKRRNIVLGQMYADKKIGQKEYEQAKAESIQVHAASVDPRSAYMENVLYEAAEVLDCLPEELFEKNPTIITHANENQFDSIFSSMSDILCKNTSKIRIIVAENATGNIIGDYANLYGTPYIKRQPGSAIKPFIAYAPALEKKLIYPTSVIRDERTDFGGYVPNNFQNTYYGDVTVAESLQRSLNVPAVKLVDMCGIPYCKAVAVRFGFSFSEKDTGLAVALGGLNEGVTLNCLCDAYATLARGGQYMRGRYVRAIYSAGKELYRDAPQQKRAVGEDNAFLLTDMLRECAQSGTAKKLREFGNVAAKTGTVERGEKNSDAYCIAYTPRYTVAVWYGNDGDAGKIYGGKESAEAAKRVLKSLQDDSTFTVPSSVEKRDIDVRKLRDEGLVYLAAPGLPKRYCVQAYFSKNNLPKRFSYPEVPLIFTPEFLQGDLDNFEIIDGFGE